MLSKANTFHNCFNLIFKIIDASLNLYHVSVFTAPPPPFLAYSLIITEAEARFWIENKIYPFSPKAQLLGCIIFSKAPSISVLLIWSLAYWYLTPQSISDKKVYEPRLWGAFQTSDTLELPLMLTISLRWFTSKQWILEKFDFLFYDNANSYLFHWLDMKKHK